MSTADYHARAWSSALEKLGVDHHSKDIENVRGLSRRAAATYLLQRDRTASNDQVTEAMDLKDKFYTAYVFEKNANIKVDGCEEVLRYLRTSGFKLGVASASQNALAVLECVCLVDFFDHISTGHFDGPPKPEPNQLESVAAALNASPRDCFVVEDSDSGLLAARAAGMWSIAVGEQLKPQPNTVMTLASLRFDTPTDLVDKINLVKASV